ncbi:MAG: 3-isopropylmalate dehydratase large subunit [bacterium]
MELTLSQKILSTHSKEPVDVGNFVMCDVDYAMGHDISGPHAAKVMREMGVSRVWDTNKVVLVPDHFVPAKDIASANLSKSLRDFAREQGIDQYYEIGRAGICHVVLPEEGYCLPGDIIVGGDSHSCTYGALGAFGTGLGATDLAAVWATGQTWFRVPESIKVTLKGTFRDWVYPKDVVLLLMKLLEPGKAIYKALEFHDHMNPKMHQEGRLTLSNMAVEAGAKVGTFVPDEVTFDYLESRARRKYTPQYPDKGAEYEFEITIDADDLEPQVALPFSPANTHPLSKIEAQELKIDQVVIGSCTNARMSDLRICAEIFKGRKVHPDVRCVLLPGSQKVYRDAEHEGLNEIFADAGIAVSFSTCGPCFGGHSGVLGKGERAVSTTNRNFHGRMGHPDAEVVLASPAVAAASAILGYVGSPETLGVKPIPADPEPVLA